MRGEKGEFVMHFIASNGCPPVRPAANILFHSIISLTVSSPQSDSSPTRALLSAFDSSFVKGRGGRRLLSLNEEKRFFASAFNRRRIRFKDGSSFDCANSPVRLGLLFISASVMRYFLPYTVKVKRKKNESARGKQRVRLIYLTSRMCQ